jgi:hypothetical protein
MKNSLTSLTGAADSASRRSDTGTVRLSGRDVAGLVLAGEMHGAPYDLLGGFLGVREDRLRSIVSRWRKAGYADTGRLGPGPAWLWLTRSGQAITGLGFAATPPSLARLALARLTHLRAVLAVRLSLEAGDAWEAGSAHWRSERRLRAATIMRGLLARTTGCHPGAVPAADPRYARVVYLTAPPARSVTTRAAATLPPALAARVTIRDLPAGALL